MIGNSGNSQLKNFCQRWHDKSKRYNLNDLNDYFDKFFTLYVIYNALYVELRENIYKRKGGDEKSAINYVAEYLTAKSLLQALENNPDTKNAIENIKNIIEHKRFYIIYDMGEKKFSIPKDTALLKKLDSGDDGIKAESILEVIYRIRCNMFHGQKNLFEEQKNILTPVMVILSQVIKMLHLKIFNTHLL